MRNSTFAFLVALLAINQSLLAGLRIDLRPVQPGNDYDRGQVVDINVFLVDTGNPQGDISFRGVFLDFTDTSPSVTFPDPDGGGQLGNGQFSWINPFTIGAVFPNLPQTSWVYPLPTPNPLFQIKVPNDGEVQIGSLKLRVPDQFGFFVLDALNDDAADPNIGARVDFGFGGPGDPVTTWRAFDGQITGGEFHFTNTCPEPGIMVLLLGSAGVSFRQRKGIAKRVSAP